MSLNVRFITIILIFLLSTLSCATLTGIDSEASGNLLFQDDFSDPSSGWDRVRSDQGITDYENNTYRIYVNDTDMDYWANPNLSFSDVIIQVEATKVSGPDDNDFGIICRYQDVENFYFLVISSDGYYGVGKMKNNQQELIGSENLLPSEDIHQGEATNIIQAYCIGNRLTLYVNDEHLIEVVDDDFSSGDVGLLAGTYDTVGTDIYFDNIRVLRP